MMWHTLREFFVPKLQYLPGQNKNNKFITSQYFLSSNNDIIPTSSKRKRRIIVYDYNYMRWSLVMVRNQLPAQVVKSVYTQVDHRS